MVTDQPTKQPDAIERKRAVWRKAAAKYAAAHPDRIRVHSQQWNAVVAARRIVDPHTIRARERGYYHAHPERGPAATAIKRAGAAVPQWANQTAMKAIYQAAAKLTRDTGIRHDVDHIVPLVSPLVCGLHVEYNLQILTHRENRLKGNKLPQDLL